MHYKMMQATGIEEALGGEVQAVAALKAIGMSYERKLNSFKTEAPRMIPAAFTGEGMDAGFLGMGFQPKWRRDEMPWMPKGRYQIMKSYMPKVGQLGLDMMTRTCPVQVNLDSPREAATAKKFRVSLALQPVATALFADSPFTEGRPNGYQSYRSHIWTDTDGDRTGMLDFVFEDGFGYERYADYALDTPMYFAKRG